MTGKWSSPPFGYLPFSKAVMAVAFAIGVTAGAVAYWWPAKKMLLEREAAVVEGAERAAALETQLERQQALRATGPYLRSVDRKLNADWSQSAVMAMIQGFAEQSGIRVVEQKFLERRSVDDKSSLAQLLTVVGSYKSVRKFLRTLETDPNGFTITRGVRMSRSNGSPDLTAVISLETFGRVKAE